MNPIFQALVGGASASQILQFISRAIPKFKPQIDKAQKLGYTPDKIVEFLSDTMQADAQSSYESSNRITAKKRAENKELTKNLAKGAAGALGATGLGLAFLQNVAPQIASRFLGGANPQQPAPTQTPPPPPPIPQPMQPSPQTPPPPPSAGQNPAMINQARGMIQNVINPSPLPQNAAINPSPAPQVGPNVQQQAQAPVNIAKQTPQAVPQTVGQPQQPAPQVNVGQLLQQTGLIDTVEALRAKNAPDVIAKILRAQSGAQVKEIEQAAQVPFEQLVSDYVASAPPVETMPEKIAKGVPFKGEGAALEEPKQEKKESPFKGLIEEGRKKFDEQMNAQEVPEPTEYMPKKEKGSTVALPTGEIGEITDIRQGIATVNAQGKEYRRKVEDLIEPPMPEKDLADLYKDVLKGIEGKTGQEVSRMVSWAGYDPKTNELAFVPHTGALYVYDNISPEDSARLTDILTQRKTTGENFIGAWEAGSDSPIGAGMSQLIQKLQKERGGKGNEYKGKFEKIYDALEPAKLAAKQKHAEQKKAEKGQQVKEKKEPPKPPPVPKPEPKPEPEKKEEPRQKLSKEEEEHLFPKKKEKASLAKALKMEKKEPEEKKERYKGAKLEEIAKHFAQARNQRQIEEWQDTLEKLEEKNKVKYSPRPKEEIKRPEIEPHQLKKQKSYILDAIENAIKNPSKEKRVEINVPGDGKFKINNDKDTLEKFFKQVDKKWPTGPMPSGEPKPHQRKPLKKAQEESEEVPAKLPKPIYKQFEFKNAVDEIETHEGKVYDNVLGLVKAKSGYRLTHIPSGVLINQFKSEKSAREFLNAVYADKLITKAFKTAKDLEKLRESIEDIEKFQELIKKFRGL